MGDELEPDRPIRQASEPIPEVLVDRAGEHHSKPRTSLPLVETLAQQHIDTGRLREHGLKHWLIAAARYALMTVRKVAIVLTETDRHSREYLIVEMLQRCSPLLGAICREGGLPDCLADPAKPVGIQERTDRDCRSVAKDVHKRMDGFCSAYRAEDCTNRGVVYRHRH